MPLEKRSSLFIKTCGFPMVLRFSMIVHAIKAQVFSESAKTLN